MAVGFSPELLKLRFNRIISKSMREEKRVMTVIWSSYGSDIRGRSLRVIKGAIARTLRYCSRRGLLSLSENLRYPDQRRTAHRPRYGQADRLKRIEILVAANHR